MALIEGIKVDGSLVKDTLDGIGGLFRSIREAITGKLDPEKEAELAAKMAETEERLQTAQIEVNKIEAASPHLFVSGWRPAVGWICATALFYHYVLIRFLDYVIRIFFPDVPAVPVLDMGDLMTLLIGMLGFGWMRTAEKKGGVARG